MGATAQRLWHIDTRIALLDGRLRELRNERAAVVRLLREETVASSASARVGASTQTPPHGDGRHAPHPGVPGVAGAAMAHGGPWAPDTAYRPGGPPHVAWRQGAAGPRGEVARRSAQNIILGLGGLLVGVAALVFAIWTWSDLGTGARAGVLGVTTVVFALLAIPAHRRGLRATAETFGCLTAALLCVDAVALWLLMSDRWGNGPGYTAAALAVTGALMALYPLLVPLRSPRVIAVLLCQPVPALLVASLPSDDAATWMLPALASTALADLALVLWLGRPREGVPLRTLHVTATVLWGLTLLLIAHLVLSVPGPVEPRRWWALTVGLLLSGITGLLLARRPLPSPPAPSAPSLPHTVAALLALGMAPLAAGPVHLPALPRIPGNVWGEVSPTENVLQVLGLIGPSVPPFHGPLHLAATMITAFLALGVVVVLRRDALVCAAALSAPATLTAVPLLLGLPHVVTVVWTLVLGAVLLLGSGLVAHRLSAWTCAVVGALTLVTGALWSLPHQYTSLAALFFLGATALAAVRLYDRLDRSGARPTVLYASGLFLWSLTLPTGAFFLLGSMLSESVPAAAWWALAATGLTAAATPLALGRVPVPVGLTGDPRRVFALCGLLLTPVAPLVAGRGHHSGVPLLPGSAPWSQPPSVLLEPAPSVLLAREGSLGEPATAVAILSAGFAMAALVLWLDRPRTASAVALLAPTTLVPLPFVLNAPLIVTLLWTLMVGSALVLWSGAARRDGRLPGLTGLLTLLLLSLSWTLAQEHANVGALMAVAVVAAVVAALARTAAPAVGATVVTVSATGAFALTLPLLLGARVEYAALAPIALAASVAVAAPRLRGPLVPAAEIPACLWSVVALVLTIAAPARPELVALALAVVGVLALATAVRPGRRWYALVGALLMVAALWRVLGAWEVDVPEAYTAPPAVAALVVGWEWSRKAVRTPSSWAAYGGGLALLFLPTVLLVLLEDGMAWRVPTVLVLGLAATVWGLGQRLQAVLVMGGLVLVATSLRAFGPPLWNLTALVPNWVPFALAGVLLLAVGARYEASLERLRRLGRWMAGMR